LELTEAARQFVAREGYDPVYGARPLKRYLQHQLESKIARALIAGQAPDGSLVRVDARDGHLAVEIEAPKEAEVPVEV
jgi:ATP-dependent Clp protease ATP-binding subunit ClpB